MTNPGTVRAHKAVLDDQADHPAGVVHAGSGSIPPAGNVRTAPPPARCACTRRNTTTALRSGIKNSRSANEGNARKNGRSRATTFRSGLVNTVISAKKSPKPG